MTHPAMNVSLFRHTYVTPVMALIEVNLLRSWAFQYDHRRYCGKKATFRVEQDEQVRHEQLLTTDIGYWEAN